MLGRLKKKRVKVQLNSRVADTSHVLRASGLSGEEAESSIRFILGFGTTDADAEGAVRLVTEALTRLAQAGLCSGS